MLNIAEWTAGCSITKLLLPAYLENHFGITLLLLLVCLFFFTVLECHHVL